MASSSLLAKPFCVSHRAKGFGEIENSMAALMAASQFGSSAIEFDLHHTKDNKTIVYHDEVFKRLIKGGACPKGLNVHEVTLKEIDEKCRLENGEKVPTFDEALKALSAFDSTQFIELKDTITEEDFETIKRYYSDRPEKVLIISFKPSALAKVEKKRLEDPFFKKVKTVLLKKYGYFGDFSKFDGVDLKYVHKSKVKRLKAQGKLVGVYTKDSKRKIKKYLKKGVDFITTNNTGLCQEIIEKMK